MCEQQGATPSSADANPSRSDPSNNSESHRAKPSRAVPCRAGLSLQTVLSSIRDETYLPSWRCGSAASRLSRSRAARCVCGDGRGGESLQNPPPLAAVFLTSSSSPEHKTEQGMADVNSSLLVPSLIRRHQSKPFECSHTHTPPDPGQFCGIRIIASFDPQSE